MSAGNDRRGSPSWLSVGIALLRRPDLWPEALRTGTSLMPRRSGPGARWLARPSESYLQFRAETQYGDASATPTPSDVVTYLEWCRRQRALSS